MQQFLTEAGYPNVRTFFLCGFDRVIALTDDNSQAGQFADWLEEHGQAEAAQKLRQEFVR